MNPQEKHARFNLVVILIAVGLVAIALRCVASFCRTSRSKGSIRLPGNFRINGFWTIVLP